MVAAHDSAARPRLRLLDGVLWDGHPLPGERSAALLAALVARPTGVSDARLVDDVWADARPDRPVKALQVLVSRVRSSTDNAAVERYEGGYRLGLDSDDVDALALAETVARVRGMVGTDPDRALSLLAPVETVSVRAESGDGPLAALRTAAARLVVEAEELHARALAATGRSSQALPLLERSVERHPDDSGLRVALLRCVAEVAGPAEALGRYETYRADLADRLGVDPDDDLQRLHAALLAADDPVRTGVRFDDDALLGRAADLARLRASLTTARLTTVVGPGGIGKTSIAQALARESSLPRVHVIELVGVAAEDDVVAEVGAALGVQGSMTSRRSLTPAQQSDVRGRIAQTLGEGPTLLVLDNCEHVLEEVAALAAFLLATTRDLRILATSRAPLRIGAERLVPLSQLAATDAADLFVQRARAVRPDASLDPDAVAAVVGQLDGLPLAVELAAARVRTMSVTEIAQGLDHRFELLRNRDRTAPERHRTLEAVIGWSWELLSDDEQRALARLSVFHDGFTAGAASQVLGREAADTLEELVDQSLLVVGEQRGQTRFRSLETIREYAGMRLVEAGELDEARGAQDAWAGALADANAALFVADEQVRRVTLFRAEDGNLTDVLRRALARGDAGLVARLVASLGTLWTITGDHPRVFAVADAAEEVLTSWDPPEEMREAACEAAAILVVHLSWMPGRRLESLRATLRRWSAPTTPWAGAAYTMFVDGHETRDPERLAAAAEAAGDPVTAGMMLLWASLTAENGSDPRAAISYAERGLATGALSPYIESSLHAQIAQLLLVLGDHRAAAAHAEVAWPVLLRLHAVDDARSLRITTAMAPLIEGDAEAAERILGEVETLTDGAHLGSVMTLEAARAEVALARGDVESGLAAYDRAVQMVTDADLPGRGFTPWLMLAASGALVARVHHAPPGPDPRADELMRMIVADSSLVGLDAQGFPDLPLNGVLVVALGAWVLRHGKPEQYEDGVHLLALGQRWAYNRTLPGMAWALLRDLAERVVPGRLDDVLAEYDGQTGHELVAEAERLRSRLTSSG